MTPQFNRKEVVEYLFNQGLSIPSLAAMSDKKIYEAYLISKKSKV